MLTNILIILLGIFGSRLSDNMINDYLKSKLTGYNRFEYEVLSTPKIFEARNVKVELAKDKELKLKGAMAYLPVYLEKGNTKTQSYISLRVRLYKNVLIAVKDIKKGERLSVNDFTVKEMDVAKLRNKPVAVEFNIENAIAKRTIRKNYVLQDVMIEARKLLEKNRIVKAVKQIGNIEISFNVKTRSAGDKDDVIKVYNYKNGKQFAARVINKNIVEIVE